MWHLCGPLQPHFYVLEPDTENEADVEDQVIPSRDFFFYYFSTANKMWPSDNMLAFWNLDWSKLINTQDKNGCAKIFIWYRHKQEAYISVILKFSLAPAAFRVKLNGPHSPARKNSKTQWIKGAKAQGICPHHRHWCSTGDCTGPITLPTVFLINQKLWK